MGSQSDRKLTFKISFAVLLVFFICTLLFLRSQNYLSSDLIIQYTKEHRNLAPYILLFLYLASPGLLLPTFYLTLLAGMLWGPFWGVIADVSGATTGSTIALLISRYIAGDFVRYRIRNKKFRTYLQEKGDKGWKLNAFLRMNPIFPSAMIGYFFGLTSIGLAEFIISTLIFLLPPSIVIVSFGSSFLEIFSNNNDRGIMIKVLIFVISLSGWLILRKFSRKIGKGAKNNRE